MRWIYRAAISLKKNLSQVSFCEFCEVFQKSHSVKYQQVAISGYNCKPPYKDLGLNSPLRRAEV